VMRDPPPDALRRTSVRRAMTPVQIKWVMPGHYRRSGHLRQGPRCVWMVFLIESVFRDLNTVEELER